MTPAPNVGDLGPENPPKITSEGVLAGVGPRLTGLRLERGGTLVQLSRSTGISVSTLSRLESGGRKPTLELLLPLSRVFGVALDELVGAPRTEDPRVQIRATHARAGAAQQEPGPGQVTVNEPFMLDTCGSHS